MKPTTLVVRFCLKCYKTQRHLRGEDKDAYYYKCIKCDTEEVVLKTPPATK